MCPHCVAAVISGTLISIPLVKPAFSLLKDKLKSKKFSRQEAMRENFNILYGKPIEMSRANPGYVAFQKAMRDDHAA